MATLKVKTASGYNTISSTPPFQIPVNVGAEWGDITGTLSDQTDLQTALNGKADGYYIMDATEFSLDIADGNTYNELVYYARWGDQSFTAHYKYTPSDGYAVTEGDVTFTLDNDDYFYWGTISYYGMTGSGTLRIGIGENYTDVPVLVWNHTSGILEISNVVHESQTPLLVYCSRMSGYLLPFSFEQFGISDSWRCVPSSYAVYNKVTKNDVNYYINFTTAPTGFTITKNDAYRINNIIDFSFTVTKDTSTQSGEYTGSYHYNYSPFSRTLSAMAFNNNNGVFTPCECIFDTNRNFTIRIPETISVTNITFRVVGII